MTPEHYTAYTKKWQWPNFSPRELACKGTGTLLINEDALDKLQTLRKRLGKPLIIRSAYRSPQHNRAARAAAFQAEADPLFFKWQAGEIDKQEWVTKREEIRDRYPY
jgi:hypothetical protein